MNKTIRVTTVAGLLALSGAVMVLDAHAQGAGTGAPMRMRHPGGPGFGGPMGLRGGFGLAMRELNLSDAQREQVRSIVQSHDAEFREIGERLRTAHQGLDALITADTIDEAAIRARSAEAASGQADAAVLRARVHQELFSILTAEQQARARELRAAAEARRQERAQNRAARRQRQ